MKDIITIKQKGEIIMKNNKLEWIKLIIAIVVVISIRFLYEMNVVSNIVALVITSSVFIVFYYQSILKLIKWIQKVIKMKIS